MWVPLVGVAGGGRGQGLQAARPARSDSDALRVCLPLSVVPAVCRLPVSVGTWQGVVVVEQEK